MGTNGRALPGLLTGAAALLGFLGGGVRSAQALTVHTVTTTADVVATDGQLSLREAFAAANADGDDSRIQLGGGLTYALGLCGVVPQHTSNAAGSLVHTAPDALTVDGNGSTIQQTCAEERVMRSSDENAALTLNDLTLTGGDVTEEEEGDNFEPNGGGGGLLTYGPATLNDVVLTGNSALQSGGAVRAVGALVVNGGAITGNSAGFGAGGADVGSGFSAVPLHLTMTNGVVTGNDPIGLYLRFGTNAVADSNVSGNAGHGIFADHGNHTIDGGTVSGNGGVGFLAIDGGVTVTDATISDNGQEGVVTTGSGTFTVTGATVSGNALEGLEMSGCNGTEGNLNVVISGSLVSGNGTFGLNHAGCGYTEVDTTTFSGNGAGIRCSQCEGVTVTSCTIADNAPLGGVEFQPGWEGAGGSLLLVLSEVSDNVSDGDGGGIRALDGFGDVVTTVSVSGASTVGGNTAAGYGGGVYVSGVAFVNDSLIVDNHTQGTFQDPAGDGGGIYVREGDLTLSYATVQGNSAQGSGGGIAHDAFTGDELSLFEVDVLDNDAGGLGGGVFADFSAQVLLSFCELRGNTSVAQGGGFAGLDTAATLFATTVADNTAAAVGGGIYYRDAVLPGNPLVVGSSTVSGNSAPAGGGIFADIRAPAGVELTNSTVSGNAQSGVQAADTPVIVNSATLVENQPHNVHIEDDATLVATQSVIASAVGGSDCLVPLGTSTGYNFVGDGTCGLGLGVGDVSFGGDPELGPLQDNGGPTETHAPQGGSPLLAMVPSVLCAQADDQRGEPRPGGTGCEPGAVEQGIALPDDITTAPGLPGVLDVFELLSPDVFDPATIEVLTLPRGGTVEVDAAAGLLVYTPRLDFVGTDSFTYRICRTAEPDRCETVVVVVEVTDGASEACTIVGTEGNDLLFGTWDQDVICGLGGHDIIFALGDGDLVLGGPGHDLLFGNRGFDLLVGGEGLDLCLVGFGGGLTARCEAPRRRPELP